MSPPLDPELLQRLRAEEAVAGPEGAPLRGWGARLVDHLGDLIKHSLAGFSMLEEVLTGLFWVVFAGVAVALAILLWRAARRWVRRGPERVDPRIRVARQQPAPEVADPVGALELALAKGDLHESLRLLWAWVAGTLARAGRVELAEDTTQRELVAAARARDPGFAGLGVLSELARFVERARFSGRPVAIEEIRAWLPRVRSLLAQAAP